MLEVGSKLSNSKLSALNLENMVLSVPPPNYSLKVNQLKEKIRKRLTKSVTMMSEDAANNSKLSEK